MTDQPLPPGPIAMTMEEFVQRVAALTDKVNAVFANENVAVVSTVAMSVIAFIGERSPGVTDRTMLADGLRRMADAMDAQSNARPN